MHFRLHLHRHMQQHRHRNWNWNRHRHQHRSVFSTPCIKGVGDHHIPHLLINQTQTAQHTEPKTKMVATSNYVPASRYESTHVVRRDGRSVLALRTGRALRPRRSDGRVLMVRTCGTRRWVLPPDLLHVPAVESTPESSHDTSDRSQALTTSLTMTKSSNEVPTSSGKTVSVGVSPLSETADTTVGAPCMQTTSPGTGAGRRALVAAVTVTGVGCCVYGGYLLATRMPQPTPMWQEAVAVLRTARQHMQPGARLMAAAGVRGAGLLWSRCAEVRSRLREHARAWAVAAGIPAGRDASSAPLWQTLPGLRARGTTLEWPTASAPIAGSVLFD